LPIFDFVYKQLLLLLIAGIGFSIVSGQPNTIGLIDRQPASEDGYVLFTPNSSDTTYLIDKCGRRVHHWVSNYAPGLSAYLLSDGSLLRTGRVNNPVFASGGTGGIVERFSWSGQLLWSFTVSSATECQHHDIYPMDNGNVLVLAWDLKTTTEALGAGRNPALLGSSLWSEKVLELQPVGTTGANIVWEWNAWDHLVQWYDATKPGYGTPSQHPELIDLNYTYGNATRADWMHCNGLDYNAALDQVMISNHNFCEFWIIDHSTTTLEASTHSGGRYGKGGDLLYRWGNPQTYGRGTPADKRLFSQHNPRWIRDGLLDAGNIMVFNNGANRPGGNYSSVDIIATQADASGNYAVPASVGFGPDSAYWQYSAPVPSTFYSANISGAQRLPSGNTLVCSGASGTLFEVDTAKNVVWKYISPTTQGGVVLSQGTTPTQNPVFRCTQHAANDPAFAGVSLSPGDPIETNPTPSFCNMTTSLQEAYTESADHVSFVQSEGGLLVQWRGPEMRCQIMLYDLQGRAQSIWNDVTLSADSRAVLPVAKPPATGIYVVTVHNGVDVMRSRIVMTH
jgi:hypothetical protein